MQRPSTRIKATGRYCANTDIAFIIHIHRIGRAAIGGDGSNGFARIAKSFPTMLLSLNGSIGIFYLFGMQISRLCSIKPGLFKSSADRMMAFAG